MICGNIYMIIKQKFASVVICEMSSCRVEKFGMMGFFFGVLTLDFVSFLQVADCEFSILPCYFIFLGFWVLSFINYSEC